MSGSGNRSLSRPPASPGAPECNIALYNGGHWSSYGELRAAVGAYCPWVQAVRLGVCSLPARGPARYFGGEEALVDRVQPAEVKARHVLIMPKLDSEDVRRAHSLADSVQKLWKGGMPYDSVVAKFHDNGELTSYPDQYPVDSLPPEYKAAAGDAKSGEFSKPFEIPDPRSGHPKIGIVQVIERSEGGEYTVADLKSRIRAQLTQEEVHILRGVAKQMAMANRQKG